MCVIATFVLVGEMRANTTASASIGLYLGGENGTEYVIENPLEKSKTIAITDYNASPYRITDYVWNGGVYFRVLVTFPNTVAYSKVTVKSTIGYDCEFEVSNHTALIQCFLPQTSKKSFSIFISPEL